MMPFHPDLISTVHHDRIDRRRGNRVSKPRRGEDVRWVRGGHTGRPERGD